jgi:FMN phosphatase YigB (HAD superfamily)
LPRAIIIDLHDSLTDESDNDRAAISTIRQVVASSGVRVPEHSLQQAEAFAMDSFAPNFHEALIFKLVNRDPGLALRCITAFKKTRERSVRLRPGARELIHACKQLRWRVALAGIPQQVDANALARAGVWDWIDIKGLPAGMKISLPDLRVLEFLLGRLGVPPADCVMLGNRLDNAIRPANLLRMVTVHVTVGLHGTRQLPRDLRDVPGYTAADLDQATRLLPTIS